MNRLLLVAMALVFASGCQGCSRDVDLANAEQDDEAPAEAFESSELEVLPNDASLVSQAVKPGHWYSVRQNMKSNIMDFYGELNAFSGQSDHRPPTGEAGRYQVTSRRPVVLPRGQEKSFELTIPAPLITGRQMWMYSDLVSRFGASPRWLMSRVMNRMHPHQHQLVVLARRPDAYGYIRTLETVNPNRQTLGGQPDFVAVIPAATDRLAPLPSWALMWTNVAYVIWDDYDTATLTAEQREAMLDWLHWGGQLVVSGPESLATLKSSFLADYLPAEAGERRAIRATEIDALDASAQSVKGTSDMRIPRLGVSSWEIVDLTLQPSAHYIPGCGDLLAERWVGRGRIVVSAFSLTSPPLLKWRGFDNFFNAWLLRLPRREFVESPEGDLVSKWPGIEQPLAKPEEARELMRQLRLGPNQDPNLFQQTPQRPPQAALVTSRLRYFARDASATDVAPNSNSLDRNWDLAAYDVHELSGVASWNPHSATSELARNSMVESAGIEVPNRSFILMAIVAYLLVLVPLNWSIFSAIGRVEWAWFAVPVIAVLGTIGVVRLAQLNLGFARSRTELAIVETQPGYPRAHATRYSGLYTSLSTKYECDFADASAIAAPFPISATLGAAVPDEIYFERPDVRDARVRLGGLSVASNSTRVVHSEAMLDVGGSIELLESSPRFWKVNNGSKFDLLGVGIVRRDQRGLWHAEVGDLPAGASYRVAFQRVSLDESLGDRWLSFGTDVRQPKVPIDLQPFLELAVEPSRIRVGDACLVGWTADEVPGLSVRPTASQKKFRTLWVSQLAYGPVAAPESDLNSIEYLDQGILDDRAN